MREICSYGTVRGASGNRCPYRDQLDRFGWKFLENEIRLLDLIEKNIGRYGTCC